MGIAEYSGGKLVFEQVIVKEIQKWAPGDGNLRRCDVGMGISDINPGIHRLVHPDAGCIQKPGRPYTATDRCCDGQPRRGLRVGRTLRGPGGGQERCVEETWGESRGTGRS